MEFNSFIPDILATLVGGIILAVIFFWSREVLFCIPDITGKWYFQIKTEHTTYRPYEGMVLRYVAILWREGNRIEGTVEKTYENSTTGERNYAGKNRTRGYVSGYIEKNYFSNDKIYLHVVENGHGRESTNFYKLLVMQNNRMEGVFTSMVAEQDGITEWRRKEF